MSLSAWQSALVALVSGSPGPAAAELSDAERDWLATAAQSKGLRLTRTIQRSWRRMRLQSALRLTWAQFPLAQRDELVTAYLDTVPCTSFFDIPEACAFLRYVQPRLPPLPHLASLCCFEGALLAATAEAAFPVRRPEPPALDRRLAPHPAAALIWFTGSPEELLAAVLTGQPLPRPEATNYPVLVAAGIAQRFRDATDAEVTVHNALAQGPCSITTLRTVLPDAEAVVAELLRIRFLQLLPAPPSDLPAAE